MIHYLDESLRVLLKRELALTVLSETAIAFNPPDSQFPPSGVTLPAVDFFLYDVRENHDLRSNDWDVVRSNGGASTRNLPLVRVDCSYLVTAWPRTESDFEGEHMLLGEVMMALLRYPTLPEDVLQGPLQNQAYPLPTAALQPGQLQSLGEFWQALGGKPKAALNYSVTIAVQPFEPIEAPPPVTGVHGQLGQLEKEEAPAEESPAEEGAPQTPPGGGRTRQP
jgi:hypothetical protein